MQRHLIIIFCMLLAGCRPETQVQPTPEPETDPNHTFQLKVFNPDTVALNYRAYHTLSDLQNNTGAFLSLRIEPAHLDSAQVTLHDTGHYYVDVYSDDHTTSNWPFTHVALQNDLLIPYERLDVMRINYISRLRNYFLNGHEDESHWRAIDIIDSSGSAWPTLTDNQRYMRLTVRRNGISTIVTKDANGVETAVDRKLLLLVNTINTPIYGFTIETGNNFSIMTLGIGGPANSTYECIADTATINDHRTPYAHSIVFVKEL